MRTQYRTGDDGGWEFLHPLLGWINERSINHTTRPWRPFCQSMPNRPDNPDYKYPFADGETFWANSHYLVFRREFRDAGGEITCVHLSLRTVENDTRHDWRDFQRVKNELCGENWEAVELYPAERRVVDTANQYHLWCFPFEMPFGFPVGLHVDAAEAARVGAVQRPRPHHGARHLTGIIQGDPQDGPEDR